MLQKASKDMLCKALKCTNSFLNKNDRWQTFSGYFFTYRTVQHLEKVRAILLEHRWWTIEKITAANFFSNMPITKVHSLQKQSAKKNLLYNKTKSHTVEALLSALRCTTRTYRLKRILGPAYSTTIPVPHLLSHANYWRTSVQNCMRGNPSVRCADICLQRCLPQGWCQGYCICEFLSWDIAVRKLVTSRGHQLVWKQITNCIMWVNIILQDKFTHWRQFF